MPYTANHPGLSWVAPTPMRWESEDRRWARTGGPRGSRGLKHKGTVTLAVGIEFTEGARCPGWDWPCGEALRGSGGGLGLNVGILTPGRALPADLGPDGRSVGWGGAPGHPPRPACPARAAGAAELTVAEESGGAGTLEVVMFTEPPLVAAFAVAHTVATLALALPRARLVGALPQARLRVTQRARGAVAALATPKRGATDLLTAPGKAGLLPSRLTEEETEALRGHGGSESHRQQWLSGLEPQTPEIPHPPRPFLMRLVQCLEALKA